MLAWTFNDDRPLKGTPVKQGHNNNVDSITREVRVKQRRDFNGESTLLLPRWNDVTISTLIRFAKSKGNSPLIQPWYLTLFQRWNNVEMPAGDDQQLSRETSAHHWCVTLHVVWSLSGFVYKAHTVFCPRTNSTDTACSTLILIHFVLPAFLLLCVFWWEEN